MKLNKVILAVFTAMSLNLNAGVELDGGSSFLQTFSKKVSAIFKFGGGTSK